MMPRDFLFGLIRVPMWDYYWGLTIAQVELLTIDQPIVVYKRDDSNKPKPGEKGFTRTADQAQAAYRKWKERQEREKNSGKKINLNTFLSTGKKEEVK